MVTYEECKQNYVTVIANRITDWEQEQKDLDTLINSKRNDTLISEWLQEKPNFYPRFPFKRIARKDEIEAILEIVDPEYKKKSGYPGNEAMTTRRLEREKPSLRKLNDFNRKEILRNISKNQAFNDCSYQNVSGLFIFNLNKLNLFLLTEYWWPAKYT